jgi:SAM-dependent methyltransferase
MSDRDDWETHWERFASTASINPAQEMRFALVTKMLAKTGIADDCRILDIGSGQGDLLLKLNSWMPTATLAGVELSRRGAEISRKKVPEARIFVADLFNPPTEMEALVSWATHATCSDVDEHVDSPVQFLRAAGNYLSHGAVLVITVPGGPMSAFDRGIGHRRHFTRDSITSVLTDAGFSVDKVYLSGFPFFNLYRLLVIARGEKLALDFATDERGLMAKTAGLAMRVFRYLLRFCIDDSPWGWQVVALARKQKPQGVSQ